MYNYLGVAYIVEPATSEMKALIVKDKFVREEILIPAVLLKVKISLLFHFLFHFTMLVLTSV